MKLFIQYLFYFLHCFNSQSLATTIPNAADIAEIKKVIFEDYDKAVIPTKHIAAINVTFSVNINDMIPLEKAEMNFGIDGHFALSWKDYRLKFHHLSNITKIPFDYKVYNKLWVPNIYFVQEKYGVSHSLLQPNILVLLYADGTVHTSRRLSFNSFCPMKMRFYPFDIQECNLSVETYSYNKDYVNLHWDGVKGDDKNLYIQDFSRVKILLYQEREASSLYGKFNRLTMSLKLYRNLALHVLRDFFPCILIVMLSWVGFWIDDNSIPARVSLGITTVLTIVTFTNNVKKNSPSAGLFRSLDCYMLVCNLFVFASVVEYAFIELNVNPNRNGIIKKATKATTENETTSKETDEAGRVLKPFGPLQFYSGEAHRIDRISRVVFPVFFTIFNVVFFLFHRLHPDTVD